MHSFDVDSDVITLGIYEVIELGLSYWDFYGWKHVNLESLVTGFQYVINAFVIWYVSGCLGTGFCGDLDLITLGIDEVIELLFSDRYFGGFIDGKIGGIVIGVQDGTKYEIECFVVYRLCTGFGIDADEMTLSIDKVIELCCSYIYFEVYSDDKYEGLVTWVQYGFNSGVGWCVVGGLGTGFERY